MFAFLLFACNGNDDNIPIIQEPDNIPDKVEPYKYQQPKEDNDGW